MSLSKWALIGECAHSGVGTTADGKPYTVKLTGMGKMIVTVEGADYQWTVSADQKAKPMSQDDAQKIIDIQLERHEAIKNPPVAPLGTNAPEKPGEPVKSSPV